MEMEMNQVAMLLKTPRLAKHLLTESLSPFAWGTEVAKLEQPICDIDAPTAGGRVAAMRLAGMGGH